MLVNYMIYFSLFRIYGILHKLFGGSSASDKWTPIILHIIEE